MAQLRLVIHLHIPFPRSQAAASCLSMSLDRDQAMNTLPAPHLTPPAPHLCRRARLLLSFGPSEDVWHLWPVRFSPLFVLPATAMCMLFAFPLLDLPCLPSAVPILLMILMLPRSIDRYKYRVPSSRRQVLDTLVGGLRRLEYRG